jgi:hypothetical protein
VAVSEGDVVEFALQAVDADGDTVRFYAEDLPTGAKLTDDGEFIWRVEESQTGSHKLRFYADDGEAAAISETVVDVGRTAASLDFSKVGTVRVNREKGIRKTLKATSSSGRPVGFELVKAPAGMKLDGNQIVWLPEKDGSFRATVKASDGLMSKTQTVTFQVRDPRAAQAAAMGHVEWQLPETADIFVDGALKAKDDNRLAVDLPEGRYELTAELSDGVTAWRETVDVRGGEKVRLRATDVSFGSLSVYFLGGVGEFKLDGKKFNRQPPFTRARVPAGEHRASCRMADDLEPRDFKIVVKPDAETVIEYEVGRPPVVTESD